MGRCAATFMASTLDSSSCECSKSIKMIERTEVSRWQKRNLKRKKIIVSNNDTSFSMTCSGRWVCSTRKIGVFYPCLESMFSVRAGCLLRQRLIRGIKGTEY